MKKSSELFQIPLKNNKYIIYAPLKKIAFIGNKEMVQLIRLLLERRERESLEKNPVFQWIKKTEILNPDIFPFENIVKKYYPDKVILFLTNKCNLRCIYCYAQSGDFPIQKMSLNLAFKAIDYVVESVKKKGLNQFFLGFHGGGEPTLNWEILQKSVLYSKKQSLDVKISMATNGYFSENKCKFISDHFDKIILSFDGLSEIQNKQRPAFFKKDSFKQVMKTIKLFDSCKFSYGIRVTITPFSLAKMEEIISFIYKETGAKIIHIEPSFSEGRGVQTRLNKKQLSIFVKKFIKARTVVGQNDRFLFYSGAKLDIINRFCLAPKEALIVLPTGKVSSCFEVYSENHPLARQFIFGEFSKGNFIFNEKKWDNFANRTVCNIAQCKDCFCRWHCAGDCIMRKGKSERCFVSQEITKFFLLEKISQNGGIWQGGKACS